MISFITLSQNTYDVDFPGFCLDSKDCVYVDIFISINIITKITKNLVYWKFNYDIFKCSWFEKLRK